MVSILALLLVSCSSDAPPAPKQERNSGEAGVAPQVTLLSGHPASTTSEENFTITIKGNAVTESYQWALVNGNNCDDANYKPVKKFPANKQDTFTVSDLSTNGARILCAIGIGADSSKSQVTQHSWQKLTPAGGVEPMEEEPTEEEPTEEEPTEEADEEETPPTMPQPTKSVTPPTMPKPTKSVTPPTIPKPTKSVTPPTMPQPIRSTRGNSN